MTKWIEQLKMRRGLRNFILLALFVLIFTFPELGALTGIVYLLILFLISYISSYIETTPIWKGLFFSFLVVVIAVIAFLTIVTLFPHIPYVLLLIIVAIIAGLSTYWIG